MVNDYQKSMIFKRLVNGEGTLKVLSDYMPLNLEDCYKAESMCVKDIMEHFFKSDNYKGPITL
jgi:hypothetical protein